MVISVKNLSFGYGSGNLYREVLKDVSLEIAPGEIIILNGPSGSGKTTLLTILGGLRIHKNGFVSILGNDLSKIQQSERHLLRQKIGYIFQNHNLIKALTASQNVRLSLELSEEADEDYRESSANAVLKSVGIGEYVNFFPSSLSGGQRQRVSIARALVAKPKLILADEPTASLDKKSGQECVHILKDLAQEQKTAILLVTHDNRILDVADRIISLEDGVIVDCKQYS
ncbi:ATP-binding cassette domain-containing protein [Candidatus Hydrogenosomobacter endosymbioticus]|uniref:ABC transporter n=1 Tax=Candidatus Hydrogenosomobacter endosymbioticus TaxID=2558174 RepID=A0ABN6L3R7_9PROT|nr:ATP-binding cassette domain-containing protein [Candidatus Hydrogenosomobacter endosymbioticus]BDB96576.1 ABC transporter [Candidatus Hydrogenosomobacter endosymbioticus]